MSKDLAELIERVKAATGPDRALDGIIWRELLHNTAGRAELFGPVPMLTASIDAALALCERLLPGWIVDEMGHDCVGTPGSMKIIGWTVELSDGGRVNLHQGQAPTAPLAILLALLTALLENEETK